MWSLALNCWCGTETPTGDFSGSTEFTQVIISNQKKSTKEAWNRLLISFCSSYNFLKFPCHQLYSMVTFRLQHNVLYYRNLPAQRSLHRLFDLYHMHINLFTIWLTEYDLNGSVAFRANVLTFSDDDVLVFDDWTPVTYQNWLENDSEDKDGSVAVDPIFGLLLTYHHDDQWHWVVGGTTRITPDQRDSSCRSSVKTLVTFRTWAEQMMPKVERRSTVLILFIFCVNFESKKMRMAASVLLSL